MRTGPCDERRFERGQLILALFKGRNVLWTVTSVAKSGKAKLTAHFTTHTADITTTVAVIPDDWFLVDQEVAATLDVPRATLVRVERAARELDALFEMDEDGYHLDSEPVTSGAGHALLSLHDYLNDVDRVRA